MPLPPLPPRPQVPFRKRSLTALSASLPPLPKVPRVDAQAPRQGRDEEEPVEYDAPRQHPPEGTGLEDQQMPNNIERILQARPLSLANLGEIMESFSDFEAEQLITNRLKDLRVDLNEVKEIRKAVKQLPTSSDTVVQSMKNLLERSCAIATGLSVLVDHLLVKVPALKSDILQTSAHMQHLTAMKLPDDTVLSHLNMTNRWVIQESPPFKQMDLKALMANWRMPARAKKDDHIIQCVDFVRFYFSRACAPVEEISKYAVRVSGKHAKDPTKADLPDGIVDTLINSGLKWETLIKRGPLKERQALRDAWNGALRGVLGRALNNIRRYERMGDALVPKKNTRNRSN